MWTFLQQTVNLPPQILGVGGRGLVFFMKDSKLRISNMGPFDKYLVQDLEGG
jgi:hypothetical protein